MYVQMREQKAVDEILKDATIEDVDLQADQPAGDASEAKKTEEKKPEKKAEMKKSEKEGLSITLVPSFAHCGTSRHLAGGSNACPNRNTIQSPKARSIRCRSRPGNGRRLSRLRVKQRDVYHFGEIRTPLFEHTELFHRGVGEIDRHRHQGNLHV